MIADIAIRLAEESDLPALTDIYNQAIAKKTTADTEPVSQVNRRAWLHAHPAGQYPVYVAEENGRVIGYCSLSSYRGGRKALRFTAEISYFIDYRHHGKGVASKLIEHAIAGCDALGIKTLVAILLGNNAPSIGILQKFGFEEWGRLPNAAEFDGKEVDHLFYGKRVKQ